MTAIMPFGMYKGYPLQHLAHDADYASWLMAQDWLPDRYPEVHAFLVSLGVLPKVHCRSVMKSGEPCPQWAKFGKLCGRHYRQAEHPGNAPVSVPAAR